jgi:hypothetical protein
MNAHYMKTAFAQDAARIERELDVLTDHITGTTAFPALYLALVLAEAGKHVAEGDLETARQRLEYAKAEAERRITETLARLEHPEEWV